MAIWKTFEKYLAALLAALAAGKPGPRPVDVPSVLIGKTWVVGAVDTMPIVEFFAGIPFAKPPVGSLRFQPPVALSQLEGPTFNATQFGPACLQLDDVSSSEDCLTVNIYRPAGLEPGTKLPVMVWVFGGGFLAGKTETYPGTGIVANSIVRDTPVVFVSFNYRLGPLGFPQGSEAEWRGALNLGLKDQMAALKWINKNIGKFGGDKGKVTVFGQSAGSISIASLYFQPEFPNLARAAIMQSGQAGTTTAFNSLRPSRQQDWDNFVKAVPGCWGLAVWNNGIPCLRNASSAEMLHAWEVAYDQTGELFPWAPIVDGPGGMLPDLPSRLYKKGKFAKVPFISGTVLDEGTMFTRPEFDYTTEVIKDIIVANFTPSVVAEEKLSKAADRLLELYPDDPTLGSPIGTQDETFGLSPGFKRAAMLNNDVAFQSVRRLWGETNAKAGVKSYGYLFTDPQASPSYPWFGVAHGTDVPYVFGAVQLLPTTPISSKLLGQQMMDYWTSFATSLDPNDGKGSERPRWESYTTKNKVVLQLHGGDSKMIADDFRKEQIDYINSNAVTFHHRRSTMV